MLKREASVIVARGSAAPDPSRSHMYTRGDEVGGKMWIYFMWDPVVEGIKKKIC